MAPILRPGDVVEGQEGHWEVERKIGEGQFSEVYHVVDRATQAHVSGRQLRRRPPPPLSTAAGGGEAWPHSTTPSCTALAGLADSPPAVAGRARLQQSYCPVCSRSGCCRWCWRMRLFVPRCCSPPILPTDAFAFASLQRALKIERRAEVRTVKQEWKVLRRLAACKQAVRVHEGGEHPWAGEGVCCSPGRGACRAGDCSCCGCRRRLGDACCYIGRVCHGWQHFQAEASLHCLTLLLLLQAGASGCAWTCWGLT